MGVVVKWSASVLMSLAAVVLISGAAVADGQVAERPIAVGDGAKAASSECPKSVAARYPWIACRTTAAGTQVIAGPTGNDTWENSRVTPSHDPFVNRGGHFGPAENQ